MAPIRDPCGSRCNAEVTLRSELFNLASQLTAAGEPFVLATVVRREAPTSAQLGDTALITADGRFHGWLGGACTKDLIIGEARAVLKRGAPRLVVLTADPEVERRNGVRVLPMTCHSGGSVEVYLEPQLLEQPLIVFGDSDVAQALARLAPELGFGVEQRTSAGSDVDAEPVSEDDRSDVGPAVGDSDESGGRAAPYIVIATYGEYDESSLRRALDLDPAYIALVAGRRRFESMRAGLVAGGLDPADLDRVSSPAGLDIGARTPAEIAVSILAEMVQVRRAEAASGSEAASEPQAAYGSEAASGMGAGPDRAPEAPGSGATPAPHTAGSTLDPVCGMTVPTDSPHRAEHGGVTFYFCCDGCRRRFLATPGAFSTSVAP